MANSCLLTSTAEQDKINEYFERVLLYDRKNAAAYSNAGYVLQAKGDLAEAIQYYQKAIRLDPNLADAHYNLANALVESKQFDGAIKCFQEAIQLNPSLLDAHINLGNALQKKGRYDEAIIIYRKALQLSPNHADLYYNLGIALQKITRYDEAVNCYRKSLDLNPDYADVYNNLAFAFQEKSELDEAIRYYRKALDLNPDYADVYCNLASAFQEKGELDEAIRYYRKAIRLDANHVTAHWNLSLALLASGNYKDGWKEYKWRWKTDFIITSRRAYNQPLWQGENISGRTILLFAEQGFGDTIQFIRYAPLVARLGANVIVDSPKELRSIIKSIEGVKQVIWREEWDESDMDIDVRCPLLDLPLIFNTTLENIPSQVPYLTVDYNLVQKWGDRIKDHENLKLKIGLVYAGSFSKDKPLDRSDSLEIFSPLGKLNNVVFYSLQIGNASIQAKNPPDTLKIMDFTDDIYDFSDTAAIIENLDLVISVDTAVAHLAGALGKPVWTLIPFTPDWRWLLNRNDSPWYPTMRLFRQPAPGDWGSVISKIKDELLQLSGKT
jgi:tetratricopeptide (TPR) repeat protein